jgi:PTS system galactitol-specific IIB component
MKRILIACGTGMLTSAIAKDKLEARIRGRGCRREEMEIETCKVADIGQRLRTGEYDLVITTAPLAFEVPVRTMNGVPFLTGKGIYAAIDEIIEFLELGKAGD